MARHCHWKVQPAILLMCFYLMEKEENKYHIGKIVSSSGDVAAFIWIYKERALYLEPIDEEDELSLLLNSVCLFLLSISLTCFIIRFS